MREGSSPRFINSIASIDRGAWERCFVDEIEGYDYHRAIENAGILGFTFGWYALWRDGVLVCAIPSFTTCYDLATTAQGFVQRVLKRVQPAIPGGFKLTLCCLGSPETEHCQIGFDPSLSTSERKQALAELLEFWIADAHAKGAGLLGIKDICNDDLKRHRGVFERFGFKAVASLPSSKLDIDFTSIDDYLGHLSYATRKDMRRKLKARSKVDVSFTRDVTVELPEIVEMYRETRARSDWTFEELSGDYFATVLNDNPDTAFFALYRSGGELVAANLIMQNEAQLLDKFFVMRADAGRALNLYFLSWFANVERCLASGLKTFVAGQAAYDTKMRLGCVIEPNWIFFRHRNPLVNALLRAASPLLAVEQPKSKH